MSSSTPAGGQGHPLQPHPDHPRSQVRQPAHLHSSRAGCRREDASALFCPPDRRRPELGGEHGLPTPALHILRAARGPLRCSSVVAIHLSLHPPTPRDGQQHGRQDHLRPRRRIAGRLHPAGRRHPCHRHHRPEGHHHVLPQVSAVPGTPLPPPAHQRTPPTQSGSKPGERAIYGPAGGAPPSPLCRTQVSQGWSRNRLCYSRTSPQRGPPLRTSAFTRSRAPPGKTAPLSAGPWPWTTWRPFGNSSPQTWRSGQTGRQ